MDPRNLQRASFRGIVFLVTSAELTGGRRVVRKLFPNSDRQVVEDLGRTPNDFTLNGCVAAALGVPYEENRDALVEALETKGPGVLVHPFLGRIENAVVVSYTLNEDVSNLGDSPLTVNFTIDDGSPSPQVAPSVVGSVERDAQAAADASEANVAGEFGVTTSFFGNFQAGVDKVNEVANRVTDAIKFAVSPDADPSGIIDLATDLTADARALVQAPSDLASRIKLLLLDIPSAHFADAAVTMEIWKKLFDFGEQDVVIVPTTPALIERLQNQNVLNAEVQATVLGQAYLSASQLSLSTVEDVDEVAQLLEDQFQALIAKAILDADTLDALASLRTTTKTFFDQQKTLRPRVITVDTTQTTARLLAFQYYGASDRGEEVALLNDLNDSAIPAGPVRILSA